MFPFAIGRSTRVSRSCRFAALAAAILALAGLAVDASAAAPPVFSRIPVDAEFIDEFWSDTCAFEVSQRIVGMITVSGSLNEEGHLLPKIERYRLTHTLIGTGEEISWQDRGANLFLVHHPDGTVTLKASGVIVRLVVPGEGLVMASIGLLIEIIGFDPATGQHLEDQVTVLWTSGPNQDDADAEDFATVCAWLAG
jgi:hypothetical protein